MSLLNFIANVGYRANTTKTKRAIDDLSNKLPL